MSAYRDSLPPEQRAKFDAAIAGFAAAYAEDLIANAQLTPEQVAAASVGVRTGHFTLAEMTDRIRADRARARARAAAAKSVREEE